MSEQDTSSENVTSGGAKTNRSTVSAYEKCKREAIAIVEHTSTFYATDIFPEPKEDSSRDLWVAKMARHVCSQIICRLENELQIKRNV